MAGQAPPGSSLGERDPVFVTIGAIKYGFQASRRSRQHRGTLGHTAFTGQEGVIFGANSPKPNRASLVDDSGASISSFIDPSKEEGAKKAGWTVTRSSKIRGVGESPRTVAVFVEMPGGWNYAWRMGKTDFGDYAAILGIQKATGGTNNLVWGAQTPKPPKASKRFGRSIRSTFVTPKRSVIDKAVGQGWAIAGLDYDLIPEG